MKHFMQPRHTTILGEANDGTAAQSSSPNPSSVKSKSLFRRKKHTKENDSPSDLNSHPLPSTKMKSPLPPRPPSSNPLKRKLSTEALSEIAVPGGSETGVKVIVRMRPLNKEDEDGEMIVQKLSSDSLTINGQTFTFDAVADTEATQLDMFQLLGAPLVENCLAGFNSSVFAYGQTGSGKTYTMWGPTNALLEENLSSDQQGLTPRVFERLFSRINEEQIKHAGKQLKYQCRCSFLEIYNEQITDLLNPNQKNLQIREDVKSGVYVENLTEEYVCTMKDVTRLLLKGLSNRRIGATSINSESSRSHSVFTCVVESQCKSMANGISSCKTSRLNLVDLAGSERQKLTGAAGERLKEAGNINRSLSQLGNLINILAEVSQTGKQRHIPYRDSRLTFLLQESLGGNAKLAMVCAISPAQSCKSETFSTLRFAQRAKAIKNKAVVNEVMQDDTNFLREIIRQLRDELRRMKENRQTQTDPNGSYSTGWNARRSLNLLKFSLNHPRTFPRVDEDGDEEMEIDEEAVEKLCVQVDLQSVGSEDHNSHDVNKLESLNESDPPQHVASQGSLSAVFQPKASEHGFTEEQDFLDIDVNMEEDISTQVKKSGTMIFSSGEHASNSPEFSSAHMASHNVNYEDSSVNTIQEMSNVTSSVHEFVNEELPTENGTSYLVPGPSENGLGISVPPSLTLVTTDVPPVLKSPTPSVSPRINDSRKSLRTSSMLTASQKDLNDDVKLRTEAMQASSAKSSKCLSSNNLSAQPRSSLPPTEYLAASLHRGLEIIDGHRQSTALKRSLFRFSLKPADSRPTTPVHKVDVGVQTCSQDDETSEVKSLVFLCTSCQNKTCLEGKEDKDSSNLQLVAFDGSESVEKSKKQVPKAVEKVLAGSIRREMALEEFCAKQASEIAQLNRLVQQYKHERECNAVIGQTREDKILRLESLMDGVLSTEEFMEEELASLTHEYKLLKEKYENHPEVLRKDIELKRVQDELERYRNFYDFGEKEVLLEEIQDLRSQLQFYIDSSSTSARRRNSLLQLTYSCEPNLAPPLTAIPEATEESAEEKLERERSCWMEAESKWISLAEELRTELEASRSVAERTKQELDTEKKCAEEWKEAMQMAMEGHARMLEQYADLEEKHIQLLARHRKIQEGIDDVKKAAARAGVRGAESKFINALAAEISALKAEREKERRYFREEKKGLQAQLRDTAEAVQAASELLVRLKEAEEATSAAEKRAREAEQETEKAYKQVEKLKRKHENEINSFNELLAESRLPEQAMQHTYNDFDMEKNDAGEPNDAADHRWKEEFDSFYKGEDSELSKLAEPSSWFYGYDRCNI